MTTSEGGSRVGVHAERSSGERESEARLRALATASADVIYRMSPDWSEMRQLDGRGFLSDTREPSDGWLARYIHPDDQARVTAVIREAVRTRTVFALEHRVLRPDGTLGWTLSRAVPLIGEDGEIVEWIGAASDITARKEAEAALRESEARLRLALEVAELGTWAIDLADGSGDLDARAAEIVGLPAGRFPDVARAQAAAVHPDDLARLQAEVAAGVARGGAFDVAYRVVRPDGRVRHVASRARVLADDTGRPARLMGTNRDVTAEREAETALAASEARYRALFTSIDVGFCVVEVLLDAEGRPADYRFLEGNPEFERQTGLTNAIGRTARELVPGLEEYWIATYGRVALTGEPARLQQGSEAMGRWFDVYTFRVGRPEDRHVAILFNDITERKRGEAERERLLAALQVERSRLATVFAESPSILALVRGPEHVFELANEAYLRLIGRRDVIGRPLLEAVPELRGQGFETLLDGVLATGEPFVGREVPTWVARAAGAPPEERFFDFVYLPVVEPDGAISGVIAHGNDVTAQVRARREAERARDRAERLQSLTAALAGARTLDDVATVVVADIVAALGARTGALAGAAPEGDALVLLRTVGFPEPVAATVRRQPLSLQSPLIECFRTQAAVWIESREGPAGLDARYPPIAPVWDALGVNAAAFVPLVAAGTTVGVISFAFPSPRTFDEAERAFLLAVGQQAALAMERARLFEAEHLARAEAERANRAKSEFLAVMSHELRTPLNAIAGYAELMEMGLRGAVTPEQRADLARIQQSQRHLLGLINQVLNYTRVDAGAVRYDIGDVPVGEALAAAEALVIPQVRARGLSYVLGGAPPTLRLRADREKLQQILLNLLSNAIKFTEPGGEVRMTCAERDGVVAIAVADTGIGISDDKLGHIFEPFVQVDQRLTRPHEGVGLGLAISRDLARGMGGDLAAESEPGRGSTFTLTLPKA